MSKKTLTKIAQVPQGLVPDSKDKAKQQGQVGVGRQRTQHTQPSVSGRPTKEEKEQVIRMQSIMMALAQAMDQNPEATADRLGIEPSEVSRISGLIQDTGGQVSGSLDGKWGDKTIGALQRLSKIAESLNTPKINPGKNYKTIKPAQVIDTAKSNVDAIAKLMKAIGFGSDIPGNVGVRPDSYDNVPKSISAENVEEVLPQGQGRAVQPAALDTIWGFYELAKSLLGERELPQASAAYISNPSIEKVAERIKSASIFKLAQFPQRGPATVSGPRAQTAVSQRGPATDTSDRRSEDDGGFNEALERAMVEQGQSKPKKGMTAKKFEQALNWFYDRADYILGRAQQRMFYEDEEGNIVGSKEEVKNAADYRAAIAKLMEMWQVQKDDIIGDRDPSEVVLSRSDLRQIPDPKAYAEARGRRKARERQTGIGREREEAGRGRDGRDGREERVTSDSQGFKIMRVAPAGPLGPEIDLGPLMGIAPRSESLAWLQEHVDNLSFSYEAMRSRSLADIVERYRIDQSYPRKRFAVHLFTHLGRVVDDVYDLWKEAAKRTIRSGVLVPKDVSTIEDILGRQFKWADTWSAVLSKKKNQAISWDIPMYDREGNPIEGQSGLGRQRSEIREVRQPQGNLERDAAAVRRMDQYNKDLYNYLKDKGREDEYSPLRNPANVPNNYRRDLLR